MAIEIPIPRSDPMCAITIGCRCTMRQLPCGETAVRPRAWPTGAGRTNRAQIW